MHIKTQIERPYNYVIIVGSQRSGTTLTGQILGAHSSTLVIDEDDGLYDWTNALLRGQRSHELFSEITANAQRKYTTSYKNSKRNISNIETLVLKAPNLTYSWADISQTLPNSKIVYLFRSISAVAASIMRLETVPIIHNQTQRILDNSYLRNKYQKELLLLTRGNTPRHVKAAIIALIKMSLSSEFQQSGLDVCQIKYEHLVTSPEKNIQRLLKRLNMPYEEQCTYYQTQYQGYGPGLTSRTRKIDGHSITRWKHSLSSLEQSDIQDVVQYFTTNHCNSIKPSLIT